MPYLSYVFAGFVWIGGICLLNASATVDEGTLYKCQIEPKLGDNFKYENIELWAPARLHEVRGILCLILHPLNNGGSTLAFPKPWIELAYSKHCALMTVSFAQRNDATRNWSLADQGSGRALFEALDILRSKSRVDNLSTAPVVAVGVCAAGQFAYHLAAFRPSQIAAFVTIGGGVHDLSKVEAAAKVQGAIVITPDGPSYAIENLEELYRNGKDHGAQWLRLVNDISKYDAGLISEEVYSYLQNTLSHFDIGPSKSLPSEDRHLTAVPRYLPISICGKKLPDIGDAEPSMITLGNIDRLSRKPITCCFSVRENAEANVDNLFMPPQEIPISIHIAHNSSNIWHVECNIDKGKLALGPLHLCLPIRFLHHGDVIQGGATVTLTGYILGNVQSIPRTITFGAIKVNKRLESKIEIRSLIQGPLEIGQITSTLPWVCIGSHSTTAANGKIMIPLEVTPPARSKFEVNGFSGYLNIQLKSPGPQILRVLYYGSIQ